MYNIVATEPLRAKNFSVAIWKNNSVLYELDETKFAILNAKHQFMMFWKTNKKQYTQAASINIASETLIDL